jgi:hypothetical protein
MSKAMYTKGQMNSNFWNERIAIICGAIKRSSWID